MKKKAKKLMVTGLTLGVGSYAASSMGATSTATAMGNMSSKLPMVGTLYGAGMVMDAVKGMNPKKKKKRY